MTVRADIERRDGARPAWSRSRSSAWPACFRRRRTSPRSGATSSRGVDAVGEPAAAWDARALPAIRAHQDRVRRLPQGPVPLRSARVRDHAELARRRRARPVPRPAHRPRRARRCRLPATTTTIAIPASSSATAPTCIAARRAILQNTLVLDQTMELLASVCPTLEAGAARRDPRADEEQAAAEQRRHRARAWCPTS